MGSSLLHISIAYYMRKGGGWVQIACKIAYVLNGRPQTIKNGGNQGLEYAVARKHDLNITATCIIFNEVQ